MPLVNMKDMLDHAYRHGYAVGAFDVVSLDFVTGIMAAAGRAAEVLARCTPWTPVEHLIIYNTSDTDDEAVSAMMTEGRRVLSAIPGVREVFTGNAVQQGARYRHTWLVRFCHPAVIDSYREHPDHVAFADRHFRPVAGDRISIDYDDATSISAVSTAANNRRNAQG